MRLIQWQEATHPVENVVELFAANGHVSLVVRQGQGHRGGGGEVVSTARRHVRVGGGAWAAARGLTPRSLDQGLRRGGPVVGHGLRSRHAR